MRDRPTRSILVTVLFTDIVGSTEVAKELGDRRWRELLQRHHAIIRRQLRRFEGREIDTAGDGFFAVFPRPADGVRCAAACVEAVRELGVEIRAGVHAGEAEVLGRKVSGMSVHIGARVLGVAGPGEVLITQTVRELIPGAGLEFSDRGVHALKGVPGEWHLSSLRAVDGAPLAPPIDPATARSRRDLVRSKPAGRRLLWPAVAGLVVVTAGIITAVSLTGSGDHRAGASPSSTVSPVAPITDRLILVDPDTDAIAADYPLPGDPQAIASGEGALWVILAGESQVVRIDPRTGFVAARIDVDGRPTALVVGLERVWVVGDGGTLTEIDPATNAVEDTLSVGGPLRAVTVVDGFVWTADVGATVSRVSPEVLRVDAVIETEARFNTASQRTGASLTADQRAVWVVANQQRGSSLAASVWRIDLQTLAPESATFSPFIQAPAAAAVGPGGVWITSSTDHAVFLLEPAELELRGADDPDPLPTSARGVSSIRVNGFPIRITVDASGSVWAIDGLSGVLWRIDPLTKSIDRTIDVPRGLAGIAAEERGIWVTVNAP
jgi:class 3 adenylate cyclase/streptogramin lyase